MSLFARCAWMFPFLVVCTAIRAADVCPVALSVPEFACRNGTATAYVEPRDGASYQWTVEGATIVEGSGTHRVTLQVTDRVSAKVSVLRSGDACPATGVIQVREPLVVRELVVPESVTLGQPVTVRWSYEPGREPASQVLTGDAFVKPVVLAGSDRAHTFVPKSSGARTVELRASYARSITLVPVTQRRRAMSGARTSASECPMAVASAKMSVSGCVDDTASIEAPEDVAAGSTFFAGVGIGDGQRVEWAVENGTVKSVSPFTETVEIIAGPSGTVRIAARIEQKPGCFISTEAEVAILQSAANCAAPPTASLSVVTHDCDSVTLLAHFTGEPPFAGRGPDGKEFRTHDTTATFRVASPGTHSITEFRDSACYGSGASLTVESLRARAKLELLESSCGSAKLAATFEGEPPFAGWWRDGQPFTTSEHRIERTVQVTGDYPSQWEWSIAVHDRLCPIGVASNTLQLEPLPKARVWAGPYCQTEPGQSTQIGVYISRTSMGIYTPVTAEWSDGVVTTGTINSLYRTFAPIAAPSAHYTVERVKVGGCEAELESDAATIVYRPAPIMAPTLPPWVCANEIVTAKLSRLPAADAVLRWTARGDWALVAGPSDGVEFPFTSRKGGVVWVSVAAEHADRMCNSKTSEIAVNFMDPGVVSDIVLDPAVIPRGGASRITWQRSGQFWGAVKIAVPPERASSLVVEPWGAMFIDKAGPGVVPITFSWTDCRGPHSETVSLTVQP